MKVLFLDIDGVVNPFQADDDGNIITRLDEGCVMNLARVVKETDCKIVISSTWKASPHLMDMLDEELFPKLPVGCVVGCTCTFIPQRPREDEIAKYLVEHSDEIDNFVVVDDYDFELKKLMETGRVVITDALKGLTIEDANKCISLLNNTLPNVQKVV